MRSQRNGKTVAKVALNWCVSHKGLVAIPKSDSADHVRENCGASGWRLPAEDIELLNTTILAHFRSEAEMNLHRIGRYCFQQSVPKHMNPQAVHTAPSTLVKQSLAASFSAPPISLLSYKYY